jgi:hypothetical protein
MGQYVEWGIQIYDHAPLRKSRFGIPRYSPELGTGRQKPCYYEALETLTSFMTHIAAKVQYTTITEWLNTGLHN